MFYSISKRKDNISAGKPLRYYPCPKSIGKISLRDLAQDIALSSSLTRGDVESVILNLVDTMTHYLEEGMIVELDEFCRLRLSFHAEGSDTAEEVNHHKINF